jgi:hypothetical protein
LINFSLYPPTPKSLSLSLSLSLSHTHTHTHTHNSLLVFSLLLGFHVTYTLPIIKLRDKKNKIFPILSLDSRKHNILKSQTCGLGFSSYSFHVTWLYSYVKQNNKS